MLIKTAVNDDKFAQEFKKRKIRQWLIIVFGFGWFGVLCSLVILSGMQVKEQGRDKI